MERHFLVLLVLCLLCGELQGKDVWVDLGIDDFVSLEGNIGEYPTLHTEAIESKENHDLAGKAGKSPGTRSDEAGVKVFVFSDYQCGHCRRVVGPTQYLFEKYGEDKIQIIFKNVAISDDSKRVARAAMAAFNQGMFWEMHDIIFEHFGSVSDFELKNYAKDLGLDLERFEFDSTNNQTIKDQLEHELALYNALGLRGTPSFIINGFSQSGWGSPMGFEQDIEYRLESTGIIQATDPSLTGWNLALKDVLAFERYDPSMVETDLIAKYLFPDQ